MKNRIRDLIILSLIFLVASNWLGWGVLLIGLFIVAAGIIDLYMDKKEV